MMLILELCFRFFCCGLFAIGGGLATLPFLYNISKETGWYTFNDRCLRVHTGTDGSQYGDLRRLPY